MQGRISAAGIRSRLVVCLIVLVLLAFTSIRTSPVTTAFESGHSVASKVLPKQRHLSAAHSFWVQPIFSVITPVRVFCSTLHAREASDASANYSFGRYFNLPPPTV